MRSHSRQYGFRNPMGVCSLAPGRVLVAENGRSQLVLCHSSVYELRERLAGSCNKQGADDVDNEATADQARLFNPRFAVAASNQVVYFSDANCVRRFMPTTLEVRTVAGVPAKSAAGVDGVHDASRFNTPMGLALDEEAGVLYVADSNHHCIKRISLLSGEVTTVVPAGRGLRHPIDLALHRSEVLFCSDEGGVKCIELQSGTVATFAGYSCGYADGPALSAKFNGARGICLDGACNLYVCDRGNSCVRRITPEGDVSTVVPSGLVLQPYGIDISHKGELLVTDAYKGTLHVLDLPDCPLSRPDDIKVPCSTFTRRMAMLLESGEGADVTFEVGGEHVHAHRLILTAQSDYFRSMLAPERFAEGTSRVVQVPDTTPGALRALLRYLYTDELSFSDDVVLDVMLLAQKMLLPRVQQHCLLHTREGLSPTNAVDWLIWAEEHSGHEQLRSAAFTFLSTHFRDVRKRREQLSVLVTRRPDLVVELLAAL